MGAPLPASAVFEKECAVAVGAVVPLWWLMGAPSEDFWLGNVEWDLETSWLLVTFSGHSIIIIIFNSGFGVLSVSYCLCRTL